MITVSVSKFSNIGLSVSFLTPINIVRSSEYQALRAAFKLINKDVNESQPVKGKYKIKFDGKSILEDCKKSIRFYGCFTFDMNNQFSKYRINLHKS